MTVIRFLLLSGFVTLMGCSKSADSEKLRVTQLNELLAKNKNSCKTLLLQEANALITHKKHFLFENNVPAVQKNDGSQTLAATDNISISGTLLYNDRPSHVRFDTYPTTDKKYCVVSYQLDYQLDVPCLTAREEAFKKWLHQGKLGKKTNYYTHKRKVYQSAYLTSIDRGIKCLVSKRSFQTLAVK